MSTAVVFPSHARRALALIVVVYVLAALGTLTLALAFRSRVGLWQTQLALDQAQQDEIALAACAQATRLLALDDPNVDSYADAWSGGHPLEIPPSPGLAEGISWQAWWWLEDESAKINVNLAPWDVLARIESPDAAAVASILDWIDEDNVPNPDGAEQEYYANLSPAYACRNGPLETLEELMFIKGITAETYFGTGQQEPTSDLPDPALEQTHAMDNEKGSMGLPELLTVYGDGKINLNTARPAVLKALPFLSDAARDEILSRQQPGARKFTTLEDIRSCSVFTATDKIVLLQMARFNSSHFQLHVGIRPKGSASTYEYTAILERDEKAVKALNWQRRLPRAQPDDLSGADHADGSAVSRE